MDDPAPGAARPDGGRITIVVLLLFEAAGLPLPVVGDFPGTLRDRGNAGTVLEQTAEFIAGIQRSSGKVN